MRSRATAVVATVVLGLAASTDPLAQRAGAKGEAPGKVADVARLRQVEGNVLVSQDTGLASAAESVRLEDRSRVITTANGRAVIVYDDGCEVTLEPNQRVEVRTDRECAARVAETAFRDPAGLVLAPAGATGAGLAALGVAGAAGLYAIIDSRQGTSVSPN